MIFDCTTVSVEVADTLTWRSDAVTSWHSEAVRQYVADGHPVDQLPTLVDADATFPERLGEVICQGMRYRLGRVGDAKDGHLIRAYLLHKP